MRRIVHHSYLNVAYFRNLFDRVGLRPEDIRSLEDLPRIPITDKRDIIQVPPRDLIDRRCDPAGLLVHRTSGSTGHPFQIRTSRQEDCFLAARRLKPIVQWGWRAGDKFARVKIVTAENKPRAAGHVLRALGIVRFSTIDALAPPTEIRSRLLRLRPQIIMGYPATLSAVAGGLKAADRKDWNLKFVVTGGATVTDFMRQRIADGFSTSLFEIYACHEVNLIAFQCNSSHRLHVCDDTVIVEILKNGQPAETGETGEVVITSLYSFSQPFIRFRLHDFATRGPAPCPCGSPFSTIERVCGRLQDWIHLPDGASLSPDIVFSALLDHSDWIEQFQMVQPDAESLVLKIVLRRQPQDRERRQLEEILAAFAPVLPRREVCIVPEIPPDASGKFRVSISAVSTFY